MKSLRPFMFFITLSLFITPAFALDLEEARSKKLISEQPDGYIQANDPKAKDLEKEVNNKRKAAYEQIVKENGGKLTIEQVGQQAAKKIREKNP
ncbi:YdbL family protein [bacterium]|nr:YdbL family protein [bacterium]